MVAVEAALGDAELAGERVQLVERLVAGQVRPHPAARGHGGRVDHERHRPPRSAPRRCRGAAATTGSGRRRRRPCGCRRAGACSPRWNARTPVRTSHGTCSASSPPPGISSAAIAGSDSAVASRSSYPSAMPRGDPADRTLTRPGSPSSRRQARRGSRVSSTAPWKVHGHVRERRGQVGADLGVDLEVGVEEPEGHARPRRREVVLGEPDQPGQLATGGGPGVVEPEQHEDRQVGVAADRRDRGDLGRQAPPIRPGRPRAAGPRRPRPRPARRARARPRPPAAPPHGAA